MAAIDTTPVNRLGDTLTEAANLVSDLSDVDDAAAHLILSASLSKVPRRTGSLASGHTIVAGHIRNQRPYAVPVHAGYTVGTRKVAGRPWLVQGEAAAHTQAVELYSDRLDKAIGKVKA